MGRLTDRIRESLKKEESEATRMRYAGMESFLGRNVGGSNISWGLVLLGVFAVYAVINILIVVFHFFG